MNKLKREEALILLAKESPVSPFSDQILDKNVIGLDRSIARKAIIRPSSQ
jgi:hypothetical protein